MLYSVENMERCGNSPPVVFLVARPRLWWERTAFNTIWNDIEQCVRIPREALCFGLFQ